MPERIAVSSCQPRLSHARTGNAGGAPTTPDDAMRDRAGSAAMANVDGKEHMLKRHEIVVRIIEANSRRLHLENERNGLDIERRIAERDLSAAPDDVAIRARLATLQSKIAEAQAACLKLEAERDWLDQSLAAFDGIRPAHEPSGRA